MTNDDIWEADYADLCLAHYDDVVERLEMLYKEKKRRKNNGGISSDIWVDRNGNEIPVHKMTEQHLINAIRYFEKELKWLQTGV